MSKHDLNSSIPGRYEDKHGVRRFQGKKKELKSTQLLILYIYIYMLDRLNDSLLHTLIIIPEFFPGHTRRVLASAWRSCTWKSFSALCRETCGSTIPQTPSWRIRRSLWGWTWVIPGMMPTSFQHSTTSTSADMSGPFKHMWRIAELFYHIATN